MRIYEKRARAPLYIPCNISLLSMTTTMMIMIIIILLKFVKEARGPLGGVRKARYP